MNFKELVDVYNKKKNELIVGSVKIQELTGLCDKYSKFTTETLTLKEMLSMVKELETEHGKIFKEVQYLNDLIIDNINKIENLDMKNILLLRILTESTWKHIGIVCSYSESRVRQLYKLGFNKIASTII